MLLDRILFNRRAGSGDGLGADGPQDFDGSSRGRFHETLELRIRAN